MRRLIATALMLFAASPALAADRYEFDKSHTAILFYISHLGFSDTVGRISDFDGYFTFDEKEPEKSSVDVTLKPASIVTASPELDEKLEGDKFFNIAKFAEVRFVSTGIKLTGKNTGDITGNLTMLGVTKPITLKVTFTKAGYNPYTKLYTAGFKAEATLKRSDFGMSGYIPDVGDEVRVTIDTEGSNITRKQQEAIKH